jgi:Asparagine synthase
MIVGAADPDRPATVYTGIRRLLPSETVTAGPNGVHVEHCLPRLGGTYRRGRVEDFATELRERLDAAVGRAIGPSESVAVLASGGLDSSGVLALAARRCRGVDARELSAISLQAQGPGDDRPYFARLVEDLDVAPVRLSASDAGKWFRQSLCVDGQPVRGPGACLEALMCATAASLRADATLCGSAGDVICGGPLPFAQLAMRGRFAAALKGALRIRAPWSTTPWGRVRSLVLGPLLPKPLLRAWRGRRGNPTWMTSRFQALVECCRDAREHANRNQLPDTPDEWMEEFSEGDGFGLPDIADSGGQMLAATRVAVSAAFMDFDFVRFVFELDPVLLSHGNEYRGLYRLAMKGVLPELIRNRQDKATYEPAIAAAALAANALEMLRELASFEALASAGLVDPVAFRPTFDRWLHTVCRGERGDRDPGDECLLQVWQLLSVETFLRQQGQGRDLI